MEGMKEAIDEFKRQNGNNNFTNKEMLMYLIHKTDTIVITIGGIKVNRSKIHGIIGGAIVILPVVTAVIGWMIIKIIELLQQ